MAPLPEEVLIGTAFGLLLGVLAAVVAGVVRFADGYLADGSLPAGVDVAVALPLAAAGGVQVGFLGWPPEPAPRLAVAALVAAGLALYAGSAGESLAGQLAREIAGPLRRGHPLAAEAVDAVDAAGQVTIRTAGEVRGIDGYPPLPPAVETALSEGGWRLPADLPLSELEDRLADRLRTDHDLAAVRVAIDARGRATLAAAPAANPVAERTPGDTRAVAVDALLPTGLSPGDAVTVETPAGTATGTTLATTRRPTGGAERPPPTDDPLGDGAAVRRTRLGTPGGEGRLTVAVPTADAGAVLRADRGRVAVHPTGTTPEFEAVALLERAGQAVRRLRLDRADLPEGVRPLAVRRSDAAHPAGWVFDVDPDLDLDPGTELFVAGTPAALDRLGTAPDAAREADG